MRIRIITVGKPADPAHAAITRALEKRLSRWAEIDWRLLSNGQSVESESTAILKALRPGDYMVLLDERGVQRSTPRMADKLEKWLQFGRPLVFVIGGAYGVHDAVRQRADFVWSFSELVFPHQLMRILLVEQLYRMFNYRGGGKYHH